MSTGDPSTPEQGQYPPPGQQSYPPPGSGSYPPPGQQPTGGQYPPPAWGQPTGAQPMGAQPPLTPAEERNWAMAAHLSSILAAWFFLLGAVGPLVVLLIQGKRSAFVRAQSVEALNFNISILIYSVVAWILAFVLIGFLLLGVLFVFQVVFTVIAAVKVSNGEPYRYPLTLRLVS